MECLVSGDKVFGKDANFPYFEWQEFNDELN